MLDENLTWKSHIEMVAKKISKVTGILYRLKNIFPENVLFVLYNSLTVSYINYGLLLWGVHVHKLEHLQKKALRFMTNSGYIAYTTPLLIKHGLLNVRDMYKLKLLKFYYKLSYDLLPPYFNHYIEVIEQKKIKKSHSYNGFAFNVTRTILDTYDPICRIELCYVCIRH